MLVSALALLVLSLDAPAPVAVDPPSAGAAAAGQPAPVSEPPAPPLSQVAPVEPAPLPVEAAPTTGSAPAPSLNPDLSLIADVAGAWFSRKSPLQSGEHDPRANGFALQQLELAASAAVDPYLRLDSFIVFKLPRPDGESGGVEIEEITATTTALPGNLQLRVGQFLTRFGRFNPTHPHTWDFVDQPFAIGRIFGGDGNRGLGLELSYLMPLPWFVELIGSVTHDAAVAIDRWGQLQATVAVRQFFPLSDDWSLLWGLSGAAGTDPSNPTDAVARAQLGGSDLYLKYRPVGTPSPTVVSLHAEGFFRRRSNSGQPLTDAGGFASLFWRFAQRWAMAGRYELGTPSRNSDGVAQGLCPADDPMCLDLAWTSKRQRIAANVTFWPSEFSRLRLQSSADLAAWQPRTVWAVMLAFEFAVGAHGAHAF